MNFIIKQSQSVLEAATYTTVSIRGNMNQGKQLLLFTQRRIEFS